MAFRYLNTIVSGTHLATFRLLFYNKIRRQSRATEVYTQPISNTKPDDIGAYRPNHDIVVHDID
ncbi:protein of unknown function [Brevefilum fermentans]|uniref:Uncharacterized protein n=1 Tax=Candidatus Brevifilum fermentans TaxID=1986204 RepID=A0A1Y6K3R2_9CHLR|nr:protein of unknown function [Brevefilum fermentans]